MYFANPWGFLGLLALPAILAIHLYHRRFPPLEVAGLHLWALQTRKESPGRKRERLPLTRTLLLELLAALLITLLIADPRNGASGQRTHWVIVLDQSASMAAITGPEQRSARDRAIAWLEEQAPQAGRDALYSVLQTGQRPTLIAGPKADWADTRAALETWQPRGSQHAFEPAWDLAAQLAGENSSLLFLTDRLPGDEASVPERMEVRAFGQSANNVAVTAARWTYSAETGDGTLFARIANFARDAATVALTVRTEDRELLAEQQTLSPGMEKSFQWILPGGLKELQFQASGPDDPLAIDDELTLIEPQVRRISAAVILPSDHPAFEPTKKILGVLPDVQLGDPETADLIIAPASDAPRSLRGLWWWGIGPIDLAEAPRGNAKNVVGPFLIEKQHPLMNGIVLGGVVWGGVQSTPPELIPVVSTGASVLIGEWSNVSSKAYLLNIDLGASNLTESPDWPILWTNLVQECLASRPGFRQWNYQLEEPIRFTLPRSQLDQENDLLLVFGETTRPLVRTETVDIPPRNQVGVYEVRDGETSLGRFAVNFLDREESQLIDLETGVRRAQLAPLPGGIHFDNPFSWLLAIGIVLTLIAIYANWYVLRKPR